MRNWKFCIVLGGVFFYGNNCQSALEPQCLINPVEYIDDKVAPLLVFYKPFFSYVKYNKISNRLSLLTSPETWNSEGYLSLVYYDYKFCKNFLKDIVSKNILVFGFYNFLGAGFTLWFLSFLFNAQHYFGEILSFSIPRYDFLLCEYFLYDDNPIKVFYRFDYDFGFKYKIFCPLKETSSSSSNNNENNINNNENKHILWPFNMAISFIVMIRKHISQFWSSSENKENNSSKQGNWKKKYKAFYFYPGVHFLFDFSLYKYEKIKPFVRVLPIGYNFGIFTNDELTLKFLSTMAKSVVGNGNLCDKISCLHKISFVGFEAGIILAKKVEVCFLIKPFWIKKIKGTEKPEKNPIRISLGIELKFIST